MGRPRLYSLFPLLLRADAMEDRPEEVVEVADLLHHLAEGAAAEVEEAWFFGYCPLSPVFEIDQEWRVGQAGGGVGGSTEGSRWSVDAVV